MVNPRSPSARGHILMISSVRSHSCARVFSIGTGQRAPPRGESPRGRWPCHVGRAGADDLDAAVADVSGRCGGGLDREGHAPACRPSCADLSRPETSTGSPVPQAGGSPCVGSFGRAEVAESWPAAGLVPGLPSSLRGGPREVLAASPFCPVLAGRFGFVL